MTNASSLFSSHSVSLRLGIAKVSHNCACVTTNESHWNQLINVRMHFDVFNAIGLYLVCRLTMSSVLAALERRKIQFFLLSMGSNVTFETRMNIMHTGMAICVNWNRTNINFINYYLQYVYLRHPASVGK